MKKFKKILIVIPIIAILICSICVPISALSVNDYGFTISNQRFGATQDITWDIPYYSSNLSTYQYGDNQIEFRFSSGHGSSASAYRPMSFDLTAGNSNPEYSVNLQFVSYYADSSNNVFGFDGPAWAYINKTRVTNLQSYSRTPSSNSSLYYSGGSFTFTINANETKKISISSGYNESYLQTVGYGVWITVSPIDQSGAIIDNQNENTQDIIDNQNSNTQAEIEADKENTQAIIDNQNQLAEQEKQDVIDSGNDSIDGATDEMPDTDVGNVFDNLISVLSHTNTDCYFEIPRIYIPKISNYFPETTLYNGGRINLKDYVDMIPEKIISVVRALLTAGLIIYCFKELWHDIFSILKGNLKVYDSVNDEGVDG